MEYVINPEAVEKWALQKHIGVTTKILAGGENITVVWSRWEPGSSAPEHMHVSEQMGIIQEGSIIITVNGQDFEVNAGEYYHIPPNAPHAERNEGKAACILTDFFSPPRTDLLHKRFDPGSVVKNPPDK